MKPTLSRMLRHGVIAVVRMETQQQAARAIEAMLQGGISIIEITWTTPNAAAILQEIAQIPEVISGAGTILTAEDARVAAAAGAAFVASPMLDLEVINQTERHGLVSMAGAFTPTEILAAWRAGADLVKLFPMLPDPVKHIATLRGPFPDIRFAPSGGITEKTARPLLQAGAAMLNVGSWLTHEPNGSASPPATITERARKLMEAVRAD
ncbi:MAG: bifunctional 4-hydroxy-2-oxoglutarate aldolase/2-dehydro-3-deoxy-phosphogluconate aldolase [Chlorobi bacterium CHB2]|nr:bifunctional 4-hydroxy-2-oxoglutarate aldolase/2-dehydro-3-deoxy-phosphogluconate aldolase [Chlorobi bacterium CHB2]